MPQQGPRRNRERRSARNDNSRRRKKRILIVCEGTKTEPQYFNGFKNACKNPRVEVMVQGGGGVPRTVVSVAKEKRDEARKMAKRYRDRNLVIDRVWCVFDVDEHPNLNSALNEASAAQVDVALSNPCFELWLVLHLRDCPGCMGRHQMQSLLAELLNRDRDKNIEFGWFAEKYSDAVRRAQRLHAGAARDCEQCRNPTTNVFQLTELIRNS